MQGNFKPVEVVSFDGTRAHRPARLGGGGHRRPTDDEPPKPKRERKKPARCKAKVREEADAEGSTAVKNKQAHAPCQIFSSGSVPMNLYETAR